MSRRKSALNNLVLFKPILFDQFSPPVASTLRKDFTFNCAAAADKNSCFRNLQQKTSKEIKSNKTPRHKRTPQLPRRTEIDAAASARSTLPIAYPPSRPVRPHASRPQTRSMPPAARRSLFVACLLLLSVRPADAGPLAAESVYPNFAASSYEYIDTDGAFLESSNGAFRAAIQSPGKQQHQQAASFFYLVVLHAPSGTPVWAANRDAPAGPSGRVQLSPRGLAVMDTDGSTVLWSTPTLGASVGALRLRDDGNLQLLDARNATLWQSFDSPTDTLLTGQQLRAGGYLSSPRSSGDFSQGDYWLAVVAASDVALTWQGSTYWRLSNDLRSFKDRNAAVAAVSFNASGLYAVAAEGALVFRVDLAPAAGFRVLKLGHDGRLRVTSYAMVNSSAPLGLGGDDFVAPAGDCDLPLQCPSLGLCSAAAGNSSTCTCPPLFAASATVPGGCTPGDGSTLASPADSCKSDYNSGASVSYLALKSQIAYFATRFDPPTVTGVKNAGCRALCTANCTCLGYFHDSSSKSCYLIGGKQLGSLYSYTRATALGYMKTFKSATRDANNKSKSSSVNHILPIVLPSIAAFLLVVLVAWLWSRRKSKNGKKSKANKNSAAKQVNLGHHNSRSRDASYDEDPDDDDVVIPGMPARFSYAEIASMTASFGTKVGAGGFGSVYKGELPGGDGLVAVKKLEAVGVQAKREFCTEITVIGSIRHVNLVRLRGFCAEGKRRLLVYEYMNRGSLDRSLFGSTGPALEWGERLEVALGAARGLAYLHAGCDQKIVHCDVKPENILLADGGQVKISDFGLAKLMSPEHSAIFTTMRGTRGYLAPEWLSSAAISDRADVYSFGMVLLELVHGRKNRGEQGNFVTIDVGGGDHSTPAAFRSGSSSSVMTSTTSGGTGSGCGADDYFPMVALELHEQGRYLDLVDARLEGRVSEGEVSRTVRVALCCLHEDPAQRPSMAAVVRALEGSAPPPEPRVEALGFLRLYGRGYGATLPATSGSASDAAHRGSASTTTPGWLNESLHDTDTSMPS